MPQAVFINTAGGVTGGDRFSVNVDVAAGASLTTTTQAAERAYRAQPDQTGHVKNSLTVAEGGRLNWLPQETILFDGCAMQRSLSVELEENAQALICEPVVFGRTAMGEVVSQGAFYDTIDIRRNGRRIYLDKIRLRGPVDEMLSQRWTLNGCRAMASVVFASPNTEAFVDRARAILPQTAGASLIQEDLLAIRIIAPDSHDLRLSLIPILKTLSQNDLPRPWMI